MSVMARVKNRQVSKHSHVAIVRVSTITNIAKFLFAIGPLRSKTDQLVRKITKAVVYVNALKRQTKQIKKTGGLTFWRKTPIRVFGCGKWLL